ncbi:MAG: pilus assembly protein [Anaerolineae bacterium]|jgi:hypothetical protein|nr:pilus assembly protein [Anaerolineae bacterium]
MRNLLKKVIKILDGTPRPRKHKRERGQSVLEMTMITPLLIILLVGLVEIGWFARNYLTLLEVTRVGARRGAVLAGDNSPLMWNEWASLPYGESYDPRITNYPPGAPEPPKYGGYNRSSIEALRFNVRVCGNLGNNSIPDNFTGFYNLVLCQMLASLSPLQIRYTPGVPLPPESQTDDIVISVFAIQMINNNTPTADGDELLLVDTGPSGEVDEFEPHTGYIPVVVGRYPTKANECNQWVDPLTPNSRFIYALERDPFDFYRPYRDQNTTPASSSFLTSNVLAPNPTQFADTYYSALLGNEYGAIINTTGGQNGGVDVVEVYDGSNIVTTYPLELAVLRDGVWVSPGDVPAFDPYTYPEMVRGFSYSGHHRIIRTREIGGVTYNLLCFGSEFSSLDIQNLLRNNSFFLSQDEINAIRTDPVNPIPDFNCVDDGFGGCANDDVRRYMANQGIVLVEVFWQHRLLLDIPVFSPIYTFLGNDRTTISVWSAFPAPSVVPSLKFNQDVADFLVVTP